MGILGEKFEGRIVIGLSGHKSESTVKQYIRKLPSKKKCEMCSELATNILPKQPRKPADSTPPATISVPPPENAKQAELPHNPDDQENMQFVLEELNAPIDSVLENFLAQLDAQHNQPPQPQPVAVPNTAPLNEVQNVPAPQPTLNMNVQNVQNINPNKILPAMYFPQSNVTINYNFGK